MSEMIISMPYVVFCKGWSTLIIRNLHFNQEIVTLNLENDYFVCFTNMPSEIIA